MKQTFNNLMESCSRDWKALEEFVPKPLLLGEKVTEIGSVYWYFPRKDGKDNSLWYGYENLAGNPILRCGHNFIYLSSNVPMAVVKRENGAWSDNVKGSDLIKELEERGFSDDALDERRGICFTQTNYFVVVRHTDFPTPETLSATDPQWPLLSECSKMDSFSYLNDAIKYVTASSEKIHKFIWRSEGAVQEFIPRE